MISFTPTYISITPDKRTYSVIITDHDSDFSQFEARWVVYKKTINNLNYVECPTVPTANLSGVFTLDLAKLLQSCNPDSSYIPALLVTPKNTDSTEIGIKGQIIIPVIDESAGTILSEPRNESVLGALQTQLSISQFNCSQVLLFHETSITCRGVIMNNSSSPLLVDIVSTVKQSASPQIKTYEERSQNNILIQRGQPYELSFIIPKNAYSIGKSDISATASFRSPGIEAPSYIATAIQPLYYIPLRIILLGILTIVTLSAILIRKLIFKRNAPLHGTKKTNDLHATKA